MRSTFQVLLVMLLILFFWSCDQHQKRGTKFPNGKYKEEFQVIERGGSFLRDGEYKTWYQSGQQETSGTYLSGKKTGNWKEWYANGQLASDLNYKNDSLDGNFVTWHDNGQKAVEANCTHGHRIGKFTSWHRNGKLKVAANYEGDKLNGEYVEYFDNGNLNAKGPFRAGKKDGPWVLNNDSGELFIEELYENGRNVTLVGSWKVDPGSISVNYFKDGSMEITEKGNKTVRDYSFHYPYLKIGDGDFLITRISKNQYEIVGAVSKKRFNAVRVN